MYKSVFEVSEALYVVLQRIMEEPSLSVPTSKTVRGGKRDVMLFTLIRVVKSC